VQTRRDQLQAYRFLTRRALAALVTGEPNAVEPPMRRLTLTTVSGIMIAAVVAAGFAFVGLVHPSVGDKWRKQGAIIVERETGARYVLLKNVLHPVLNYSSAVLAVSGSGGANADVVLVDRAELNGTTRGPAIGIAGIPDSLPSAANLVSSPWTACSRQQADAQGSITARVSLYAGSDPARAAIGKDAGVIARTPSGDTYLLWHGTRMKVGSDEVLVALGLKTAPVLTVGTSFLNAVPAAAPLQPPHLTGLGAPGPQLSGRPLRVGQILQVGTSEQFFVALQHGFAPVDFVQAHLLEALPMPEGGFLRPLPITEDVALGLTGAAAPAPDVDDLQRQFTGLPDSVPAIDPGPSQGGGLCAVYRHAESPTLQVPPSRLTDALNGPVTDTEQSQRGLADEVVLAPGHAAVVSPGSSAGTVFVVADPGKKYAAASIDALAGFGYGAVRASTLPAGLLGMIPLGPALDAEAARRPVSG
jgi:type VII secretion protein EccB